MQDISSLAEEFVREARDIYGNDFIPLHRPVFEGNERKYLEECIDSNFVSSVGSKVVEFERSVQTFTGSEHAIATVNGTSALHVALRLVGVQPGDEVITQALTFVATCNAIAYAGANPLFVDVDIDTMGLSPKSLSDFLAANAFRGRNGAINKSTGNRISACVPMHTFGLPCRISEIAEICLDWGITLVEDAAESLGSSVGSLHTGRMGAVSTLSFNGNKVITTGGGGMLLTDDDDLAVRAKHLTTTGKVPHPFEFYHDELAYNYRMPNLNAALGCAQMERLPDFIERKSQVTKRWCLFFKNLGVEFVEAVEGARANHWLNAIVLGSLEERNHFLRCTNENNVMTRPIWTLMSKLPMYQHCQSDGLQNSLWLESRVVNIPSSVPDAQL